MTPSPAKKAKTGARSIAVRLEAPRIADGDVDMRPFLVDDASLADGVTEYRLLKQKQSRKGRQRVVRGETAKVNIRACNFGDQTGSNPDFNYVVLVLDPDRGCGTAYDAEQFLCHRSVKLLEAREAAASEAPTRSTTPAQDYRAARTLLAGTFGTKRIKSAINSQEKNQINIGQLESTSAGFIKRSLDKTIGRIQEAAKEDAGSPADSTPAGALSDGLLPPHDDRTADVAEIYKAADLIPSDAYYALPTDDFAEDSAESWEAIQARFGMHDFCLDRIRNAVGDKDAGHRLRCLLYLHYLLKFRELKEGGLNSEAGLAKGLPGASAPLVAHLLGLFTEPITVASGQTKRKVSALCKDRIVTHICVLVLLLEAGFKANLTILSTVLHIPVTRMTDHFRAVGCAVEKPAKGEPATYTPAGQTRSLQIKYACLKAPLTFPKPKRGPMK